MYSLSSYGKTNKVYAGTRRLENAKSIISKTLFSKQLSAELQVLGTITRSELAHLLEVIAKELGS